MIKTQDKFQSLSCSSDGKFIAGAFSNVIKIFEANTGKECFQFVANQDKISCIKYSPDNSLLITIEYTCRTTILDAQTCKQKLDPFKGTSSGAESISFSRSGEYLAFLQNGSTIGILDLKDYTLFTYSDTRIRYITSIDLSPNGSLIIASDSHSSNTRILNTRTGKYTIHRIDYFYSDGIQYSPNGKMIAQGSHYGIILVSDVKTKKQICRFQGLEKVFKFSFSPNGDYLVQQSWNNCIRLWDIVKRKSQILQQSEELLNTIQFSDNKRYLVYGSYRSSYNIIQIRDGWPE